MEKYISALKSSKRIIKYIKNKNKLTIWEAIKNKCKQWFRYWLNCLNFLFIIMFSIRSYKKGEKLILIFAKVNAENIKYSFFIRSFIACKNSTFQTS